MITEFRNQGLTVKQMTELMNERGIETVREKAVASGDCARADSSGCSN